MHNTCFHRAPCCLCQTSRCEDTNESRQNTFLLTKEDNTMMGRSYIFVGVSDVSHAVRTAARSSAKEIDVPGCQNISMTAATDTPGVLTTNQFSC